MVEQGRISQQLLRVGLPSYEIRNEEVQGVVFELAFAERYEDAIEELKRWRDDAIYIRTLQNNIKAAIEVAKKEK